MPPFGLFSNTNKQKDSDLDLTELFAELFLKVVPGQSLRYTDQLEDIFDDVGDDIDPEKMSEDLVIELYVFTAALWKSFTYLFVWNAVADGMFKRVDGFMHEFARTAINTDHLIIASLSTRFAFEEQDYDLDQLEQECESIAVAWTNLALSSNSSRDLNRRCGVEELDAVYAAYESALASITGVSEDILHPYMRDLSTEFQAGEENNFGKLRYLVERWADESKAAFRRLA
jgi:hypothetical protein